MNLRAVAPATNALLAAFLFGANAPLAKLALSEIHPVMMAAFLYLGSGLGLILLWGIKKGLATSRNKEAFLQINDLKWLAGAILAGGVAAPILLMTGLASTPASTVSLLLAFEVVATIILAYSIFREHIGQRVWIATGIITAGTIVLSFTPGEVLTLSAGALGVIAACLLWGLDNNLTRVVSLRDPLTISLIKGLVAGTVSFGIAMGIHAPIPGIPLAITVMALGFVTYGLSIFFFVRSLRTLGVARTGAYFSSAPFIGAVLSVLIFQELPDAAFFVALPIMTAGLVLLAGEKHVHWHTHPPLQHEHRHRHDDGHHLHDHTGVVPEEHSHPHTHNDLEHTHPHVPDIHHRHEK
jgi:drug/metabolite transporter (DMT)-like permease